MITKYIQYLNEGRRQILYTEKDPEFFLIKNYKRNEDGSIDCFQMVDISEPLGSNKMHDYYKMGYDGYPYEKWNFTRLSFKIRNVYGNFYCQSIKNYDLTSGPKYVENYYNCGGDNKVRSIEDYPLCIIGDSISDFNQFKWVCDIVKKNVDKFEPLVDDKIRFHQMVMRLEPNLIPYYKTIEPPTKKSILLNI